MSIDVCSLPGTPVNDLDRLDTTSSDLGSCPGLTGSRTESQSPIISLSSSSSSSASTSPASLKASQRTIARNTTQIPAPTESIWTQFTNRLMILWRGVFFPPHKLHDEKYHIALETQRQALSKLKGPKLKGPASDLFGLLCSSEDIEKTSYYRSVYLAIRVLNSECADVRLQYQMYHKYLRSAIESMEYEKDSTVAKEILFCLCKAKFEENFMLDYHKKFQQTATGREANISGLEGFTKSLTETNTRFKHPSNGVAKAWVSQTKQKLEGSEILPGADNIGRSNIPEVRSYHTYSGGRTITSLRHGTVIISPEGWQRKMAPEYRCYLHAKQKENKHVLYVNHQRAEASQSSRMDMAEVKRSEMLHGLEKDFRHLHCISLPMDGPMFDGDKPINVDSFKADLKNSIENQKFGFMLPRNFDTKDLKIDAIFDFVHSHYFNRQTELSKVEKKEFMMIFYFYLKERLKYCLNIESVVTVCKDNKDRGNASGTIDELLLAFHTDKHKDSVFLKDLHDRFFGAYMIKYEEIIPKRIDLVRNVALRLAGKDDSKAIREGYGKLIADDQTYSPFSVLITAKRDSVSRSG